MKIKIQSLTGKIPAYETEGASGVDLRAFLDEPVNLKPLERKLIPTGIFVEIPKGYEGQVRPRSGISLKYGITLINGVGTIDSDYRGELKIPLVNLGEEDFVINDGDRIAQMIIATFELCEEFSKTKRGENGFGHSGLI